MLALLIGSGAFPTSVDAASSTSAQADSKSGKASGKLMLARVRQTTLAQQSKLQAVVGASLADACTDSCAQTQADGIASCNASLVPAICAGEPACEAEIIFLRDSCIAEANAAYNACTAVSTLPDSDSDGALDTSDNSRFDEHGLLFTRLKSRRFTAVNLPFAEVYFNQSSALFPPL